jgi:hypothetical protein
VKKTLGVWLHNIRDTRNTWLCEKQWFAYSTSTKPDMLRKDALHEGDLISFEAEMKPDPFHIPVYKFLRPRYVINETTRTAQVESNPQSPWEQVVPPLSPEEFITLKNSIATFGLLTEILVDQDGRILDGHHRARACNDLGIDITSRMKVIECDTDLERQTIALVTNTHRRQLTKREEKDAIQQASEAGLWQWGYFADDQGS